MYDLLPAKYGNRHLVAIFGRWVGVRTCAACVRRSEERQPVGLQLVNVNMEEERASLLRVAARRRDCSLRKRVSESIMSAYSFDFLLMSISTN